MKFYDCRTAPSPRRVRIFLAEKGLTIETIQVDLANQENLKPAFLAINPRGVVPTLVLDDGTVLDEAVAVCRYIEETHPNPPLMGTDARSKAIIEARNRHIEQDGFLAVANVLRNTSAALKDRAVQGVTEKVPQIPELAERGRASLRRFFEDLERHFANHPYVAGSTYSIADITALVAVDFSRWIKAGIPPGNVYTERWHAEMSARPSAKA